MGVVAKLGDDFERYLVASGAEFLVRMRDGSLRISTGLQYLAQFRDGHVARSDTVPSASRRATGIKKNRPHPQGFVAKFYKARIEAIQAGEIITFKKTDFPGVEPAQFAHCVRCAMGKLYGISKNYRVSVEQETGDVQVWRLI